ncbi:uncharacterized protein LOC123268747 [Cotesia glomerata]|uniref:Peptidase S1 domain-containing protein n=1 Tax=Cotesia glomerata TaxID=32391 RepID=A0AAV7I8B2_COTGL|nr:uncharacterized protein LOC123268747 [Cotesia glomerata]KAH0546405.1 hypothetical protein KQX54_009222 [Cotesia glomerata]
MFKLLVPLIIAVVLVDSSADQKFIDSSGLDERTMYGWEVNIASDFSASTSCYGIFIGPRVFLTHSECVKESGMSASIQIVNTIYNSEMMKTQLSVKHRNVYTGNNIKKGTVVFDRKVALLITDEPVIPLDEITANSFVKLPEDINDVDFSKCFMPEVSIPPMIVKRSCQLSEDGLTEESVTEFTCTHDLQGMWYGSGLFCQLKENSGANVLAGYVGNEFLSFLSYFRSHETVINLSGLNIKVMNL